MNQRNANNPLQRHGFTLLEVLVSIAIIAVLSIAVFSSLGVAFNARRSATETTEPYRKLQLTMGMIRQDLQSALPPTGMLVDETLGREDEDDDGQPMDSLRFFSSSPPMPWEGHPVGFRRIDLLLREDEDLLATETPNGHILVRQIVRNTFAPVEPEPQEEILCRNVRAFNLRYFDGADWVDEWDAEIQDNTLPKAVEVYIELMPDNPEDAEDDTVLGPYLTMIVTLPASVPQTPDESGGGGGTVR